MQIVPNDEKLSDLKLTVSKETKFSIQGRRKFVIASGKLMSQRIQRKYFFSLDN